MKNKEEKLEWWEKKLWNEIVKKIHERDKIIEELSKDLLEVQQERDELKKKLEVS